MKEKQEYTIPNNVRSDFEIVQNVTLKDMLCFLPALLIVIPILLMPVTIYLKIPVVTISCIISAVLVYLRPVRENIPFWQHVRDYVRFSMRQKVYYYKKEEWRGAEVMEEDRRPEATETGRVRARLNTGAGA